MTGTRPSGEQREAVLRAHLRALGEPRLLATGEELAAAALVADARVAENELAALSAQHLTDLDHAARLRARIAAGDEARGRLIDATRHLVVSIVRRHPASHLPTQVLLDAGDEALTRAVDRYDPTGGLPFSAFARWWVERALREVERDHEGAGLGSDGAGPADATLLTALGHLHEDDCRVIELRLGLHGGPALSIDDTASMLGIDLEVEHEREERALAKLRHPSTPGDLTHLRGL